MPFTPLFCHGISFLVGQFILRVIGFGHKVSSPLAFKTYSRLLGTYVYSFFLKKGKKSSIF